MTINANCCSWGNLYIIWIRKGSNDLFPKESGWSIRIASWRGPCYRTIVFCPICGRELKSISIIEAAILHYMPSDITFTHAELKELLSKKLGEETTYGDYTRAIHKLCDTGIISSMPDWKMKRNRQ